MRRLSPYWSISDERGSFTGITQYGWEEINIIETRAFQTRGNHYHKEITELFYIVSGEVQVSVRHIEKGEECEFTVAAGDIFVVEPLELHTLYAMTDAIWLNMLSRAIDPNKPDFHRLNDENRQTLD